MSVKYNDSGYSQPVTRYHHEYVNSDYLELADAESGQKNISDDNGIHDNYDIKSNDNDFLQEASDAYLQVVDDNYDTLRATGNNNAQQNYDNLTLSQTTVKVPYYKKVHK